MRYHFYWKEDRMYIKRTIEETIQSAAKSFPCIAVYGPRQVGKSTTVKHLFGNQFHWVTLDNLEDRKSAKENPHAFLLDNPWPLIIDEIQKVPELMDEIKIVIDQQRLQWLASGEQRQLMYILTGSNRYELQQGVSDSLAGRCGILEMQSFSLAEKYGNPDMVFSPELPVLRNLSQQFSLPIETRGQLFEEIFQGSMPDICTGISERGMYYQAYISTYIEKDVRRLISASKELQFRDFISLMALRTGQELHYDSLANDAGIDVKTCKKWVSILETSGIIYLLRPYLKNASNRIIKAPKVYFMDTGLCAFLCKWPTAEMLEKGAMGGAFFETFVVSEIIKKCYSHYLDPKESLFYYRDTNQKEVDLLYVAPGKIYPIEVKKGTAPSKPTKNFNVLQKFQEEIQPGLVIDSCEKIRSINENAYSIPVGLLGV